MVARGVVVLQQQYLLLLLLLLLQTYKEVDVVIIEQSVEMRKYLPHAGTNLSRRQAVDQRQKLLKKFYADKPHNNNNNIHCNSSSSISSSSNCDVMRWTRDASSSKNSKHTNCTQQLLSDV